jgi:Ca2+-binding RTX toxin-like protein
MRADELAFMRASGGEGDDRLGVDIGWPDATGALRGGPGADVLVAPRGLADGGPGDDRLQGATVSYAGRAGPLVADLAAGTATLPGEHDTLVGEPGLIGTNADDIVTGGAGSDGIDGGPGDDRLTGLDGNDHLAGGSGDDVLEGGTGDDDIQGRSGSDRIDGGYSADVILAGPGQDSIDGGRGRDRVDARDGAPDEVDCARFGDGRLLGRATVDAGDVVLHCLAVDRIGAPAARLLDGGDNPLTHPPVGFGEASVGCSQDVQGGCRGTLASMLPDGSARSRATSFRMSAGADWPNNAVSVPLSPGCT